MPTSCSRASSKLRGGDAHGAAADAHRTVKLGRPADTQKMVQDVLTLATQDSDNPDLRDRGYIYRRLLPPTPRPPSRRCSRRSRTSRTTPSLSTAVLEELIFAPLHAGRHLSQAAIHLRHHGPQGGARLAAAPTTTTTTRRGIRHLGHDDRGSRGRAGAPPDARAAGDGSARRPDGRPARRRARQPDGRHDGRRRRAARGLGGGLDDLFGGRPRCPRRRRRRHRRAPSWCCPRRRARGCSCGRSSSRTARGGCASRTRSRTTAACR